MNLNELRNLVEMEDMGPPDPREWSYPGLYLPPGQHGPLAYKPRWVIVDYDGPGGDPPGFFDGKPVNPNPTFDYNGDGVIGGRDHLVHPNPQDVPAFEPIPTFPPSLYEPWYPDGDVHYPGHNHGQPIPTPPTYPEIPDHGPL